MNTDDILEKVKVFADKAHGTQMRKYTPERYIVHPERVMNLCREFTNDISMLAAALLHDVLEDTPVGREEMLNFLKGLMPAASATETLKLVEELSDVYVKEDYPQYNRKKRKQLELERIIKTSSDAQTIKYADILDNCTEIVRYDRGFAPRFLEECKQILLNIRSGEPRLYQRSLAKVEQGLSELRSNKGW